MRRLIVLVAALALSVPFASPAKPLAPHTAPRNEAAIAAAGAGILSSSNVSLVASIPDAGGVGGRFVRADGKVYYFTTGYAGLRIFDATNAELPILVGALPLPVWENEDVDVSVSRRLVLVSVDNLQGWSGGALYVISWADPRVPQLKSMLLYPARSGDYAGPGHIANCIADCNPYAYITGAGGGSLTIVNLADPAAARFETVLVPGGRAAGQNPAGAPNGAFRSGTVHDVNSESATRVWATGSGGTALLDVANPLYPTVVASIDATDNNAKDQFIHHNAMRLDSSTVLVTEEDWLQPFCGSSYSGEQGGFQTWKIPASGSRLTFADQWMTELGVYLDGRGAIAPVTCSSHWFTFNDRKVVAVGWYDQGVRFLDVSVPTDIRQVGYWIRPSEGLGSSAGLFHPVRNDIVYVPDYERGLDILKIDGGGAAASTVVAPIRREWLQPGGAMTFRADPVFGFACLRPLGSDAAPVESAVPASHARNRASRGE